MTSVAPPAAGSVPATRLDSAIPAGPATPADRRPERSAALLLLLALPLGACGDAASPQATTATVDTVNGVERLTYPGETGWRLAWTADTVLVLGDAFAEDVYQFNETDRQGLAATSDGGLLVLDRQGKRVLRYGPDGEHLRTYGRAGGGPGELSQPLGMVVGPGDTVWVSDLSNSRLTGYPAGGGEARSLPFPENSGFPSMRMAAMEAGHLLQFRPMFNFRGGSSGGFQMSRGDGSAEERKMLPLVRYHRDTLQPGDTIWSTPEPPTDMVQLEMGDRLMVQMMAREFHPEFMWDEFSDGGLVISDTAAYVLHLLDADGTVERTIERNPPPRPTTEADREAARQRVRSRSRETGGMRIGGGGPDEKTQQKMLEQRLEKMTFSELVPSIVRLEVDEQDRIWVGVSEEVADEIARIDVYDRDGRLVGELRDFPMPDLFLSDGRVAVLRRDEMDVQQVVVLRVQGDRLGAPKGG